MAPARVVSFCKVWDRGAHCAFTDLARFRGKWFCAFREAGSHAGSRGKVRILESEDGRKWRPAALLPQGEVDLRDPKLSVTPWKSLMLLMGGTPTAGRPGERQPLVAFSTDGRAWSRPQRVLSPGDWLWRVSWHRGSAFGVSYRVESSRGWTISLYETADGLAYRRVCKLDVPGKPNEATIRFNPDGRALALVRRDGGDGSGWIGSSVPPYTRWRWRSAGRRVGGPNFLAVPGVGTWAAFRDYRPGGPATVIARMGPGSLRPLLTLPSGGDCGYPGLAWHAGMLWVSYYSSHEGKARIYLARVRVAQGARMGKK